MSLLAQLPTKTKYGVFKHHEMVESYMREFRHLQQSSQSRHRSRTSLFGNEDQQVSRLHLQAAEG